MKKPWAEEELSSWFREQKEGYVAGAQGGRERKARDP